MRPVREIRYDLFVSYAHADNVGPYEGKVTAIVDAIKDRFRRVAGRDLVEFFDQDRIYPMDQWRERIYEGLVSSRMMLAILSPNYFKSDFCKLEWSEYIETELAHALPHEGIAPIYVVSHPDFDAANTDRNVDRWIRDLSRRQFINWQPWWDSGQKALETESVNTTLNRLIDELNHRISWANIRDQAPRNEALRLPSIHFRGRREEMRQLRDQLSKNRIGAVNAIQGIGGIGKTQLVFAYAWGYGAKYPGGRFLISAASIVGNVDAVKSALKTAVVDLGPLLGVDLPQDWYEKKREMEQLIKNERMSELEQKTRELDQLFNHVCAAFRSAGPSLLILDNVDDASVLAAETLEECLPKGDHIHVVATTRLAQVVGDRLSWLSVDSMHPDDAESLLDSFYPISRQDQEWIAAREIAKQLGFHPLALEVVGVYLRERNDPNGPDPFSEPLSYVQMRDWLKIEGLSILDQDVAVEIQGNLAGHSEKVLHRLFKPTLDRLDEMESRALEYAALFPPEGVRINVLKLLLSKDFETSTETTPRRNPVLRTLSRLNSLRLLVADNEANQKLNTLRIHRVLQNVLLNKMSESARRALTRNLVDQLESEVFPTDDRGKKFEYGYLRSELPYVHEVMAACVKHRECSASIQFLALCIRGLLSVGGALTDAYDLGQDAVRIARSDDFSEPDLRTGYAYETIGKSLLEIKRNFLGFGALPGQALELFECCLSNHRKVMQANDPELVASINNVGFFMRVLDRHQEALPYAEEAWTLCRQFRSENGRDHVELEVVEDNYRKLLALLGRSDEEITQRLESK